MMKKTISLILGLALCLTIFNMPLILEAEDEYIEEKTRCEVSLDDDFADERVIVVLRNEVSRQLLNYTPEDFPEVDCIEVSDLTELTKKMFKGDYDKENMDLRRMPSIYDFHQILCLTLSERGKENVIEAIRALEGRDDIFSVEPDYVMQFEDTIAYDTYYSEQWAINKIKLPSAWDITTGSSDVVVGVIDSGIDGTHPDLSGNIYTSLCCDCTTEPVTLTGSPTDSGSHGTQVAGIIGAVGDNNIGVCGTCWTVKLVSLKVKDTAGHQFATYVARAVDFATYHFIPVLNYSGGGRRTSGAAYEATAAITNYPGLFVCSAGNDGTDNDVPNDDGYHYPSSLKLKNLISVANTTSDDVLRYSSNYGLTTVDLAAPGTSILSCFPTSICNEGNCNPNKHIANGYHKDVGTSMAAPFVTGVAALIMSIRPDLNAEQIKALILDNVDKIDALSGKCVTGGRLNAYKAVKAATEPQTFTGDVNGDGYADLILSRKVNGKRAFTVFRGKSDGKFDSPITSTSTKNFSYDDPAFVGDFNGDGKTDILVHWTQGTTGNLLVYTGKSDGTFNEGANQTCALGYYQGLKPYNFFVDDVNGDGKDDLIISTIHYTSGKRRLEIFKGKSTSPYINDVALSEILISTYDYDMSEPEFVGDFNGDGKADYLVLSRYAMGGSAYDKTITYLGNSSGPFSDGVSFIVGSSNISISDNVQYSVADITGDGKTDIVEYYQGSNGNRYSQVFKGKSNSPYIESNGGWALSPSNAYDQNFKAFTGDFNGDGLDDLVVHQYNSSKKRQLMLYIGTISNNTITNFNAGVLFTSNNTHNPYQYPSGLYVADVNNDGKDDFIVKWKTSTNKITIYTYLGNGTSFNSALSTTSSIPYFNA